MLEIFSFLGNYIKDLSRLGRDIRKVIIIDNSPVSYIFHQDNAVCTQSNANIVHKRFVLIIRRSLLQVGLMICMTRNYWLLYQYSNVSQSLMMLYQLYKIFIIDESLFKKPIRNVLFFRIRVKILFFRSFLFVFISNIALHFLYLYLCFSHFHYTVPFVFLFFSFLFVFVFILQANIIVSAGLFSSDTSLFFPSSNEKKKTTSSSMQWTSS